MLDEGYVIPINHEMFSLGQKRKLEEEFVVVPMDPELREAGEEYSGSAGGRSSSPGWRQEERKIAQTS